MAPAALSGGSSWSVGLAEMISYGLPRRYGDYSSGSLFAPLNQADRGTTAYTPLAEQLSAEAARYGVSR
jgi:hypothetical protein